MKLAALAALCACTVDVRIDRGPGGPDAAADAAVIDALDSGPAIDAGGATDAAGLSARPAQPTPRAVPPPAGDPDNVFMTKPMGVEQSVSGDPSGTAP